MWNLRTKVHSRWITNSLYYCSNGISNGIWVETDEVRGPAKGVHLVVCWYSLARSLFLFLVNFLLSFLFLIGVTCFVWWAWNSSENKGKFRKRGERIEVEANVVLGAQWCNIRHFVLVWIPVYYASVSQSGSSLYLNLEIKGRFVNYMLIHCVVYFIVTHSTISW